MRKRDLIDQIQSLNPTAREEFLTQFAEVELCEYLDHLLESQLQPNPNARAIDLSELPLARPAQIPIATAPAERLDSADAEKQMALAF